MKADPVMRKLIRQVGPFRLKKAKAGSHFDHVVRAIIYQQLSGKAAATIHKRVKELFGHDPTPEEILSTPEELLRKAGLSRQKLTYLKDLAGSVVTGVLNIETLDKEDDETVIEKLTQVRGIGRWTAQMFLIFRLGRKNILPTVDLGINKAIMQAYGLKKMPKPDEVVKIGEKWSPFSSVASWYLWRSLDQPMPKKLQKLAEKRLKELSGRRSRKAGGSRQQSRTKRRSSPSK